MNSFTETIKQVFLGGDSPPELNAIDILKEDHRKVEEIFKEFEAAETTAERVSITQRVLIELSVHSAAEEELVYPILMKNEQEKKTHEALEEHRLVKQLIGELSTADGTEDNFQAKMKVLSDLVKHHVQEEELDLLPKLNDTGIDLVELGAEIKARKETLIANPPVFASSTTAPAKKAASRATKSAKKKASPETKAKTAKKKIARMAAKRTPAKKTTAKTAKKSASKKPQAKKAPAKKATTRRASAKKSSAGTRSQKTKKAQATTKKTSTRKSVVRPIAAKRKKAS